MPNDETAPRAQSHDEIVARNLRRIREEKKISVAELANRIGVGKHRIYDFERPRAGAAQRQFLWSEIVLLCAGLGVTIFELVLPDEGERTVGNWLDDEVPLPSWFSDQLRDSFRGDDREVMMEILFGLRFKPHDIDQLIKMRKTRIEAILDELTSLLKEDEK